MRVEGASRIRARRVALVSALVVASLVVGAPAAAQDARSRPAPETASLGWSRLPGAESCPTAIELGEAVDALLGRRVLVAASTADLALEGRVEPIEGGFRATIAVARRGGATEGERVYEQHGDCEALLAPVATIVALLIDPDAELQPDAELSSSAPPAPAPSAPASPDAGPAPARAVEPLRPTSSFVVRVDASVGLEAFLAPSVAPLGRAQVELGFRVGDVPLGLAFVGELAPWSRASLPADAFVDLFEARGGLGLCVEPSLAPSLGLSVCAIGEAGGAFVVGERDARSDARERLTGLVELAAMLRARLLAHVSAHLGAALGVPLRTDPWLADGAAFYRPDPLGFAVWLGLGFDAGPGAR